ncbi:MAG TPA: hypothetical protein VMT85_12215 [Thermoanaerobaculia bacterium]|nr:hypothetical protein [Thermoanaerobaculia bacterium]
MIRNHRDIVGRCLLVAALCLVPCAAMADWKRDFVEGYRYWENKRYDRAAEAFRRAIADEPTENGERLTISGMTFRKYYPYFYLGDSLAKSNDCEGAVGAWQASEQQGRIRGESDLYAELQQGLSECRQVLAARDEPRGGDGGDEPAVEEGDQPAGGRDEIAEAFQSLQQQLGRADVARSAFNTARDRVSALSAPTADLDRQVSSALRDLQAARTTFDGANEASIEQLRAASSRASAAADAFDAAKRSADTQVTQVNRVRKALEELMTVTASAEQALRRSELSQTSEHRTLQRLVTESRAAGDRMNVGQIESLEQRLTLARNAFDEAVRRAAIEPKPDVDAGGDAGENPDRGADGSDTGEAEPGDPGEETAGEDAITDDALLPEPLDLARAATAFFERDYDRVVELLSTGEALTPREELAGHLLRAAAHHARYLLAGADDEQELAAAREQARLCATLDPTLDLEIVGLGLSPSFRSFYRASL